MFINAMEKV